MRREARQCKDTGPHGGYTSNTSPHHEPPPLMLYMFASTLPRASSHQSFVCVIRGQAVDKPWTSRGQAARQHFLLTVVVAFPSSGFVFLALRPLPSIDRSGRGTQGAESRVGYRRGRREGGRAPRAGRGLGKREARERATAVLGCRFLVPRPLSMDRSDCGTHGAGGRVRGRGRCKDDLR